MHPTNRERPINLRRVKRILELHCPIYSEKLKTPQTHNSKQYSDMTDDFALQICQDATHTYIHTAPPMTRNQNVAQATHPTPPLLIIHSNASCSTFIPLLCLQAFLSFSGIHNIFPILYYINNSKRYKTYLSNAMKNNVTIFI